MMSPSRSVLTLLLVLACVGSLDPRAEDLSGPGSSDETRVDVGAFVPRARNRAGVSVGSSCRAQICTPVMRSANGARKTLSAKEGSAVALNNVGQVLLYVIEGDVDETRAVASSWMAATGAQPLKLGGALSATLEAINDQGRIAGSLDFGAIEGSCPAQWASVTAEPICLVPFQHDDSWQFDYA